MSFDSEGCPGAEKAAPQSEGFRFNHSMVRVKNPESSRAFCTRIYGMRLLRKLDFHQMKFSLHFLAKLDADEMVPEDVEERTAWTFSLRGLLELTHNWGTENQEVFHYHNGNEEPQGFGHICFAVPDLAAADRWFYESGVSFVKRPEQGKMKDVAFVKDPDGYWIEIVEPALSVRLGR